VIQTLSLHIVKPKIMNRSKRKTVHINYKRLNDTHSNHDKRRTILENLRRNARSGEPGFRGLTNDDLRFRTWEPTIVEDNNAVIIAMRDVSGSMGEFEKYITRSFYFWMVRFLRTTYANVEIVFITHHTEAREVDEE